MYVRVSLSFYKCLSMKSSCYRDLTGKKYLNPVIITINNNDLWGNVSLDLIRDNYASLETSLFLPHNHCLIYFGVYLL